WSKHVRADRLLLRNEHRARCDQKRGDCRRRPLRPLPQCAYPCCIEQQQSVRSLIIDGEVVIDWKYMQLVWIEPHSVPTSAVGVTGAVSVATAVRPFVIALAVVAYPVTAALHITCT